MFFRFVGDYRCCFGYSKCFPFAGWDFLVFSCVHLALASVVGTLLFASSSVACVTTWRSTSSALLPVFVENLLSPSLFAVTVAVWRSSPVVFPFLASCRARYWVCSEFVYCRARGRSMPPPTRSTNNSLSAGLTPEGVPPSSSALIAPASASAGSGPPLSADSIADAVVRALGSSLPTIVASIQGNAHSPAASITPPSYSASPIVTSAISVVSGSSAQSSGTFSLPSFVPTFSPMSAITDSSLARLVATIALASTSSSSMGSPPGFAKSSLWPKADKAFIVGPGHAPIPAKLVAKIREGQFVELADLLSVNLRAVELEPQAFLEGKLLASKSKRRQVEIDDILTWTEAFTIFQMVTCAAYPHR